MTTHKDLIDNLMCKFNGVQIGKATLFNCDCNDLMAHVPEKHFELSCVDPPYGINFGEFNRTNRLSTGETIKANKYKNNNWDDGIPDDNYFYELIRVSKNQIVWGGNYFPILWGVAGRCFIFWFKGNPVPNFSDGELAWTSFDKVAAQINLPYYGNIEGNTSASPKIHPTQKPIKLYEEVLSRYAEPGHKILDTHGGSLSNVIACLNLGYEIVCTELDKDYFDAGVERVRKSQQQQRLFA